jgi:ATP-grasp domain
MKRIVFLESSDIGVRYSGLAARRLGFEPLFICDLGRYQADTRRQLTEFQVIDLAVRGADLQAGVDLILSELEKLDGGLAQIAAVTTFADSRLTLACAVAERLGVAGLDPSVPFLKSKRHVQKLVPEASPETFEFSFVGEADERELFPKLIDYLRKYQRVIVKPVDAAGALGLMDLTSEEEIRNIRDHEKLRDLPERFWRGSWIAQAFVRGDLISVEGFARRGEIRILGVSLRKRIGATESASTFPVDRKLNSGMVNRAQRAVSDLIARSGFKNGYFHIEFITDGEKATLIDANVGRIGGGPVAEQIAIAYGVQPVEVFEHVLKTSLQLPMSFPADDVIYAKSIEKLIETHAVLYGLERGGVLRGIDLPPVAAAEKSSFYHTQLLSPGTQVSPMGRDDWSWIGIISAPTAITNEAAAAIKITTDAGTFPAVF